MIGRMTSARRARRSGQRLRSVNRTDRSCAYRARRRAIPRRLRQRRHHAATSGSITSHGWALVASKRRTVRRPGACGPPSRRCSTPASRPAPAAADQLLHLARAKVGQALARQLGGPLKRRVVLVLVGVDPRRSGRPTTAASSTGGFLSRGLFSAQDGHGDGQRQNESNSYPGASYVRASGIPRPG
jgi:hypothetical protein